eukprot:66850-Chlamydomonas_euryale.AAC.1
MQGSSVVDSVPACPCGWLGARCNLPLPPLPPRQTPTGRGLWWGAWLVLLHTAIRAPSPSSAILGAATCRHCPPRGIPVGVRRRTRP